MPSLSMNAVLAAVGSQSLPVIQGIAPGKDLSSIQALGLLGAWAALTNVAYGRQQRKEDAERKRDIKRGAVPIEYDRSKCLLKRKKMIEHPLACWLVENGFVAVSLVAPEIVRGGERSTR